MRPGANPNALLFATHGDMSNLLIFVQEIDELKHVDVRNTGHQVDARFFQAGENLSRSLRGSHFNFPSRRFSSPVSSSYNICGMSRVRNSPASEGPSVEGPRHLNVKFH